MGWVCLSLSRKDAAKSSSGETRRDGLAVIIRRITAFVNIITQPDCLSVWMRGATEKDRDQTTFNPESGINCLSCLSFISSDYI
jgi:hypothetical protein